MNQQINLTIPKTMLDRAKKQAKEDGYRTVQEYILQSLRDKWFLENLPRYDAIAKELDEGKGTEMTLDEFKQWGEDLRKKYGKTQRTKIK